ncbi:MAG: tRNA (guanosine(37)-N1)-methyltransferase TrmD [Dehalococcoidia bacterium]|nr:tRNA (guanosine(37)-N1)-methyltransferase TrmD [Dehalococcoidia bacterium]
MKIHILTLFPDLFHAPLHTSMIGRALEGGLVSVSIDDIRQYTSDPHRTADDYQYGGGPGMVMKPEPIFAGVESALESLAPATGDGAPVILLSPQGRVFSQSVAEELAAKAGLVLICGHYGGVDERVREHLATDEISIGDYIMTGGELAAMVLVDAVVRLVPGVVGSEDSVSEDSLTTGLLQHPLYTRPQSYRDAEVPPVLLSGNHGEISRWRRRQSLLRTLQSRPDLLETADLATEDLEYLRSVGYKPE